MALSEASHPSTLTDLNHNILDRKIIFQFITRILVADLLAFENLRFLPDREYPRKLTWIFVHIIIKYSSHFNCLFA